MNGARALPPRLSDLPPPDQRAMLLERHAAYRHAWLLSRRIHRWSLTRELGRRFFGMEI